MSSTKFSIITCTYNSGKFIKDNLFSVESQKYKNFEHIFIDAFSTDDTLELINEYKNRNKHQRIKIFQHKPQGIANAMNQGVKKSRGTYVIHLHSDDYFENNVILSEVSSFIDRLDSPDLVYGKAVFFDDEDRKRFRTIPHRRIYYKMRFWLLVITNYIPHQSVFIKRNVFAKYGLFNEKYRNSMDYEMWLRLSREGINSRFINKVISRFRVRSDAQSSVGKQTAIREHRIIKREYIKNKYLNYLLDFVEYLNNKRNAL